MTATNSDRCPRCDSPGAFGYRNSEGQMIWYCAGHRLGQFWADARRGNAANPSDPNWEGWKARD
jgi:hypothetical protein